MVGSLAETASQVTNAAIRLREERQASEDRLAKIEFQNQKRASDMQFDADVKNAQNEEEIDAAGQKRSESLDSFFDDREVSDDVRKELEADMDFHRESSSILSEGRKMQMRQNRERAQTQAFAESLAKQGDPQTAMDIMAESPVFNQAEKIALNTRIQSEYDKVTKEVYDGRIAFLETAEEADLLSSSVDETQLSPKYKEVVKELITRKKKSLFNFQEKVVKDSYISELETSGSWEDVDASIGRSKEDDKLGELSRSQIESAGRRRKDQIRRQEVNDQLTLLRNADRVIELIGKDAIVSEIEITDAIQDEELRDSIISVFRSKGGPVGVGSEAFITLNEELEEWSGAWDDLEKDTKKKIYDYLNDDQNSTESKLAIAQSAMLQHGVDAEDGKLDTYINAVRLPDGRVQLSWKDDNIDLDESQIKFINVLSFQFNNDVSPAFQGRNPSWVKSPISAMDAKIFLNLAHTKAVIDQFAGLNEQEFQEKYNEIVKPIRDRAIKRNALNRYRDLVLKRRRDLE